MLKKVIFTLILICLMIFLPLSRIIRIFIAITQSSLFMLFCKFITSTYVSGILCSIISVVLIYKWQVWYSKRKIKQDFRCNECIQDIYDGIEYVNEFSSSIPGRIEVSDDCDFQTVRKENAQNNINFYFEKRVKIQFANDFLSSKTNDLLIDSLQSCFFINLNFRLLGIINNVKNRLPNLRKEFPKIKMEAEKYEKKSENLDIIQFGEKLETYFVDLKLMAVYWQDLLDYLDYDPTFIRSFMETYNKKYDFLEEMKLTEEMRYKHIYEISQEVKKELRKEKVKKFFRVK